MWLVVYDAHQVTECRIQILPGQHALLRLRQDRHVRPFEKPDDDDDG
jgi:hypothetical protein